MTSRNQSDEPAAEKFASPPALRQYAIDTAIQLRQAGLSEAADIMEAAANFVATTGSEWLGELGIATRTIRKRFEMSESLGGRVSRIAESATSRHPYG